MAVAAALVQGVVGAIGAIQQSRAAAAAAKFNAKVQEQQAKREEEAGKIEAENFRRRQRSVAATNLAAGAASGIGVASGTPLMVSEAEHREIENTALGIQYARDVRSERLQQGAQLSRMEASNFKTAGIFKAGSSLLGGIERAAAYAAQGAGAGGFG